MMLLMLLHVEIFLLLAQTQCPSDPGHEGGRPLHRCGDDQGHAQGLGLVNNYPGQRGTCNMEERSQSSVHMKLVCVISYYT